MATCLLGFGYSPAPDAFVQRLLIDSTMGAVIYTVVVASAWQMSGRPQGPERDLLNVLGATVGALSRLGTSLLGKLGVRDR